MDIAIREKLKKMHNLVKFELHMRFLENERALKKRIRLKCDISLWQLKH